MTEQATAYAEREVEQPPAPTLDIAAVLAAIQDTVEAATAPLRDEVQALKADVAAVQRHTPQFRESSGGEYVRKPRVGLKEMNAADGPRDGMAQYPIGSDGLAVDDAVLRRFPARFRPGQAVRINREAPHGARVTSEEVIRTASGKYLKTERTLEPLTWGDILDGKGTAACQVPLDLGGKRRTACGARFAVGEACPRCGNEPRVDYVAYLSKHGKWKYKVKVPGLTGPRGDGFFESDLLAAEAS